MKWWFWLMLAFLVANVQASEVEGMGVGDIAPPDMDLSHRAISLEIHGKNGGFDQQAYTATRRAISEFIADGTVDRFSVYRYYLKGGFAACLELSLTALPARLQQLMTQFLRLDYDSTNTSFYVGTLPHCG